VKYCSKYFLG